jgi:septal ring factor EnvC (AmiA/AmiB activator)
VIIGIIIVGGLVAYIYYTPSPSQTSLSEQNVSLKGQISGLSQQASNQNQQISDLDQQILNQNQQISSENEQISDLNQQVSVLQQTCCKGGRGYLNSVSSAPGETGNCQSMLKRARHGRLGTSASSIFLIE